MACLRPSCRWGGGGALGRPMGDTMYATSERKAKGAGLALPILVPQGPIVSIADMDVAEAHEEFDDDGFDSGPSTVSLASSEPRGSPQATGGDIAAPDLAAVPEPVSAKFTPGSKPPVYC